MSWKLVTLGSLLAVVALSGCSTPNAAKEPVAEAGHSRCDAKAASFVIGQKASPELLEQARIKAEQEAEAKRLVSQKIVRPNGIDPGGRYVFALVPAQVQKRAM